ncbi:MAG: regulatory protein GemA [Deltaproteobacteria bacterium]|nr:regulatory protein GemA [Deltaproteobacteria bacterium]
MHRHSQASPQTIPGTDFPFEVIKRKGPPKLLTDRETKQRRGLLAKIHVAKKQMQLNDGEYEMILRSFKVASAGDMTMDQLEGMVKMLKHYGWKPSPSRRPSTGSGAAVGREGQLVALRARCVQAAREITNGDKRLAGLAEKICGTSQLIWCHSVPKLERLLAVLGKIKSSKSEETF